MILLQEDSWISEWQTGAGLNGDESGDGDGLGDMNNLGSSSEQYGDGDTGDNAGSGESYWSRITFEHIVTNAALTITYKRI